MNAPDIHLPTPAEVAPAAPWEPKRLVRPEELARMLVPQRRRRVVVPVWRTGRGRSAR